MTNSDEVIKTYAEFELEVLHHAISVADTKASVILALAPALALAAFHTVVRSLHGQSALSSGLGLVGEISMVVGGVAAFLTVVPRIVASNLASDTYWASPVFRGPQGAYAEHMRSVSPVELSASMLQHLHLVAGICRRKYLRLTIAFYAAPIGALFLALCYLNKAA